MKTTIISLSMLLCLNLIAQPELIDINSGMQSSYPEYFTEYAGQIYFRAHHPASNQDILFTTNGTAAGTHIVKDVAVSVSYPNSRFNQVNGLLIFSAYEAASGWELWVSDGSSGGTQMLKDIIPGPLSSSPEYITEAGPWVYFQIHNTAGDLELWKSDGTAGGTTMVSAIEPAISNKPPQFCFCDGLLYFVSFDPSAGQELWRSDGTSTGTMRIKDINPGTAPGINETSDLTCFKGKVYFSGDNGTDGEELWVSDGTSWGTKMLRDIHTLPGYSGYPQGLSVVGDYLYFNAENERYGRELFRTDGTEAGTQLVADIYPGAYGGLDIYYPDKIPHDGKYLFFQGYEPDHGFELWKSAGTTGSTKLLLDVDTSQSYYAAVSSRPEWITPAGEKICFTVNEFPFASSAEFSVTDKNGLGVEHYDLRANGSSFPLHLSYCNGQVYFSADDGIHGRELWVYQPNQNQVTELKLIDAVTDQTIQVLGENDVVNLAELPHKQINIEAIISDTSGTGSLVFELNGAVFRTENVAPYALAGDNPTGDFKNWNPAPGEYHLVITPYSGKNGAGSRGVPFEQSFIVTDVNFGITHFTLVHADTDQDLVNIIARPHPQSHQKIYPDVIDLSGIEDPHQLNIRANTIPPVVDQVNFWDFDIEYHRVEKVAPYALFGDNNGDYRAWQDVFDGRIGYNYLAAEVEMGNQQAGFDAFFDFVYSDIKVTGFSLYDAVSNQYIRDLKDGDAIDLAWLPGDQINIVANTVPEQVGSVVFFTNIPQTQPWYDHYENQPPYALFGDWNGNFHSAPAIPGSYEITAVPYTRPQPDLYADFGLRGESLRIYFSFFDSGVNKSRMREKQRTDDFRIYPNPLQGEILNTEIHVTKEQKARLLIINLAGKVIHDHQLDLRPGENQITTGISGYSPGTYIVRLELNDAVFTEKLIIN